MKHWRKARGLTQRELSDQSGVDVRSISRLEGSGLNATLEVLERLAIALDVPIAALVVDPNDASRGALSKDMAAVARAIESLRVGFERLQSRLPDVPAKR
jgi:transcriptional regulator with XRE-family HTH domain